MDFKMNHIDVKCPVCGESKYMHFMQGKNVGELDMVCTNCDHYFMSKNFSQTSQQIEKRGINGKYKRKYKQGRMIRSIAEFEQCESKWYMVKFSDMTDKLKPMHVGFLISWQYRTLYWFIKNCRVFEAIENKEKKNVDND